MRLPTAKLQLNDNLEEEKLRLPTAKSDEEWQTPAERLFYRLSATHLVLLSNLKDPLKRAFYEQETIRGCWTVTETRQANLLAILRAYGVVERQESPPTPDGK